ncbi:TraU family protein [Escherichia coli]|uniref:TraU family protein n=1 Tax=Escherichia coli TaxID=562 RepID=UPI00333F9E4D
MNGAFYHVHWYKYPLTYWLNIITSLGCLEGGDRISLIFLKSTPPDGQQPDHHSQSGSCHLCQSDSTGGLCSRCHCQRL